MLCTLHYTNRTLLEVTAPCADVFLLRKVQPRLCGNDARVSFPILRTVLFSDVPQARAWKGSELEVPTEQKDRQSQNMLLKAPVCCQERTAGSGNRQPDAKGTKIHRVRRVTKANVAIVGDSLLQKVTWTSKV